jgi:hypothetical protein
MKNKKVAFFARTVLFIFVFLLYLASKQPKPIAAALANTDSTTTAKSDTLAFPVDSSITLTARYNIFDSTIDVNFYQTNDSISPAQKKNFDGFVARQDQLTKIILQKIFINYRANYLDYKRDWRSRSYNTGDVADEVPKPTTPEALIPYITPGIVRIQNKKDCKVGTIGIYFLCTWNDDGIGVAVHNWQVTAVGNSDLALLDGQIKIDN